MKSLVVLGAGTAGTAFANRLVRSIGPDWTLTVVDPEPRHLYQPGLLFVPFGGSDDLERPRARTLRPGVDWVAAEVARVEPDARRVVLANGERLPYDLLVLATGARLCPEETAGLEGPAWGETIHEFYTLEGARRLRGALSRFRGGRLVVNAVEMPIKCPVAPLEFLFLADWFFHEHGLRDRVELTYATPLPGAFTKPRAAGLLGDILEQKNVKVVPEFLLMEVDPDANKIIAYDGTEVEYDLLVTVPINMGDPVIARSGMGDELRFVPTEKHTLKASNYDNIFVLGDATNLPSSKAGSVAHFQGDVFIENFLRYIDGLPLRETFDGHANCYIESGFGKGFLIDFNYDVEPLPGKFPLPGIGPFSLLQESRINHWGKMLFRWMYWNLLLKGKPLPITAEMQMAGKWM